jgi:hypothetical protein
VRILKNEQRADDRGAECRRSEQVDRDNQGHYRI